MHYYTIDSCIYVYRLMNSMDDMVYWDAEGGMPLIGAVAERLGLR